jgi:HlyD family secretion protein
MPQPRSAVGKPVPAARRVGAVVAVGVAVHVAIGAFTRDEPGNAAPAGQARAASATVKRRDFVRSIKLNGTVEAVQATTVAAPRLAGPAANSLVITQLIKGGSKAAPGDVLVIFDRQLQLQTALDRRAELNELDQQIRRKEAEARAAASRDDSELQLGHSGIERARLEMLKNEMLPKIQAEKNAQALEQAQAHHAQLKTTYALKRQAAEADIQVLRIRRAKAESAMKQAEANASRMEIRSPIHGLAVIKTMWKSSNMAEILEGEEVRPGMPILDIVNADMMRIRARVNQVDINELKSGQPARIGLDAYPELTFGGRVSQISPLGVTSALSPKIRQFIVLMAVDGSHPNLMPDLTAAVDVELERVRGALVVPRDAVRYDGDKAFVRTQSGSGFDDRQVTLGAKSATEVVIVSGIDEGAVVERNIAPRAARGTE